MDQVSKTITVPVWIGKDKFDKEAIYVPSVDVPQGKWAIVLRLTPITNDILVFTGGYKIVNVAIKPPNELIEIETKEILEGQGYQIFVTNNLPSYLKDERRQPPVPFSYDIDVQPIGTFGKTKKKVELSLLHFDPVVIAQPDPIYP